MPSTNHGTERNHKPKMGLSHMVTSVFVKKKIIRKTLVLNLKRMLSGRILLQMRLIKYRKIELAAMVKQERAKG